MPEHMSPPPLVTPCEHVISRQDCLAGPGTLPQVCGTDGVFVPTFTFHENEDTKLNGILAAYSAT